MASTLLKIAAVCLLVYCTSAADPIVTLSHGGQLRGVSTTFLDSKVDLFLGVRYAKPPVGKLRFQKTEEAEGWKGVQDAKAPGSICPQIDPAKNTFAGEEDCLFMDITVPGGVQPEAKKPVMVWIHGGGYSMGSGSAYLGVALATTGDVITVSINYRLGVLGFLAIEKGTGNYGLWDQRAALLWVKQNIAQFGGDPDLVTIFGESAGGGSVSAHTIGQHSDGLFKRAIAQSGTAYMMFGQSDNMRYKWEQSIRESTDCDAKLSTHECLASKTAEEIVTQTKILNFLVPVADGDFFADEVVSKESYGVSNRFDLMLGVNGQEGGLFYSFETALVAQALNKSIFEQGVDMEVVRESLRIKCLTQITPFSPNLCVDWIISTYKIDETDDDKERAARLVTFLGEIFFNEGGVNQLQQHAAGETATYAYYFTEEFKPDPPNPLWSMPDWLKTSADHGDEIPFMFGCTLIKKDMEKNDIWKKITEADEFIEQFMNGISEEMSSLSLSMMTMWTNFAKSGNPNVPVALPEGTPTWPEFTTESDNFLEINNNNIQVITTPNKERLLKLGSLRDARKLQRHADQRPASAETQENQNMQKDEL